MKGFLFTLAVICFFVLAAFLEVQGDALIRRGFENGYHLMIIGFIMLCVYGFVLNLGVHWEFVNWSFSKQLGIYVAVFTVTSTIVGKWMFNDEISSLHIVGALLIVFGGIVIQFSSK